MSRCIPVAAAEACANCGKPDGDGMKLKNCTACRLVKYCGVDCQRAHRKKHKKVCKQRVAELKDEELYGQGHERPEGDFCPICTLPIPLPMGDHSGINACCMKRVCHGCILAAQNRGMFECPFCRTPTTQDNTSLLAMAQKRVDKKDPAAILFLGDQYCHGKLGLDRDVQRSIEIFTEAAELGSIEAHVKLGSQYFDGEGVAQDMEKAFNHFEVAAKKGHLGARHNLGLHEGKNGNYKRAVRHWLISAKMGEGNSLKMIKKMFSGGVATKEQYAEALRGYQESVDEMKSPEREEVKALLSRMDSKESRAHHEGKGTKDQPRMK
ncbi:hypothetical protein THAOC_22469 [Thalassiosira oceanica]|uniref:MYND-type domain-containing protein n=1 Tax=Thalassiosira oceanica TaxID=159749 RepID=K0RYB4_THAOC|nr:hypothetical protein THAOC_22469 [Thalassiosira oceanica]|eukprot:EJK57479.1 hypothetical protein THAOC_22469 [Thalassiosira oceanica]